MSRSLRAAVVQGLVVAGACAAFVAALTIENLVSSIFAVKIECSSKGMDLASWIPPSNGKGPSAPAWSE